MRKIIFEKSIFDDLEPSEQEEIAVQAVLNTYKKNQAIFLQGNYPYGVYGVNSGKIKIVMNNNEGKESIVRLVNPGEVFGYRAVFSNDTYNATAIALEESVVYFLDKEFILKIIKKHPSVALKLLGLLSLAMGKSEINNSALIYKNGRERFAGLLISLKETYGVQESNGIRLDIKLTREDMASMIGTTLESLVRLTTEFKNEGIIMQEGKVIFIINEKKLIEFANV